MIATLARNVGAALTTRGFPVVVWYGAVRVPLNAAQSNVIVVSRDAGAPETFGTPLGQQTNPRKARTRMLTAVALFFVASNVAGAMLEDHERECDQIVDAFVVELEKWGASSRAGNIPITSGRYLTPEEASQNERLHGVIYELRFSVARAVFDRIYEAATISGASSVTQVSSNGEDYEVVA